MDESLIGLIYPVLKCWMKRGHQQRLPAPTAHRQSQALAGSLNWRTGQVHCQALEQLNGEVLIGYFEWLLTTVYPTQTVVLVMDNASWHHSTAVQAALSVFEQRVMVLWLPPYSPDLNPIERFWKHLKATACANYLYRSLPDLVQHVTDVIACQNQPHHPLKLSFSKLF
jgi:transposase